MAKVSEAHLQEIPKNGIPEHGEGQKITPCIADFLNCGQVYQESNGFPEVWKTQ